MLNSGWLWAGLVVIVLVGVRRLITPRLNNWARLQAVLLQINELNQVGEVGQSMHLLNEVLTDPEIDRTPTIKLQALSFRARIANVVGRLDTALASAQEVVDARRSVYSRWRTQRNARLLGEDLALLGQVHRNLGNYTEALRVFQEVVVVSEHSAYLPTAIQTQIELARLKAGACEFDNARRHTQEAVRLSVIGEILPQQLEALDVEAGIAIARGDLVEGRRVLDVAASLVTPETNPALQGLLLRSWADLERDEGDRDSELRVLFELVRQYCDLKAGHGWRQDQAVLVRQIQEAEARLFELGFAGSLRGDEEAGRIYGAALGLLRESEIAQALRLGILQAEGEDPGLPQVIRELMFELTDLEDPEHGVGRAGGTALYEKLEAATSARFRELVELPSRHPLDTVSPGNHLVQLRLIETGDGSARLYGSWQRPTLEESAFSHQLTVEEDELLRSVTGRSNHSVPTAQAAPVRASTSTWAESAQRAALSGEGGDWGRLVDCLLPPELLDVLRRVDVNAPDAEVPLLLLATDGQLWSFPWAALPVTGQTVLIDHAAVAMVPSCSLFKPTTPADNGSKGALAYLHGVNADGIEIERSALQAICGSSLREAASPADLTQLLVGADEYAVLTMTVHGDNRVGLAHSLILDPATRARLSAARMMSFRFPRTVVVGACFSGDLDKRLGTDPTGIPTVMLCRGASTVIGGLFPLADGSRAGHATAYILSDLYRHLAEGIEAPWALRKALRWWRTERDSTPVYWAGIAAISDGSVRSAVDNEPASGRW